MLISFGMHFFDIMFSSPSNFHDMFSEIKCNYVRCPSLASRQFLGGVLYHYLHLDDCWELSISSYRTDEYLVSICLNMVNNIFKITAILAMLNFWFPHTNFFFFKVKNIKLYWMCPLLTTSDGIYSENNNSSCPGNFLKCEISTAFCPQIVERIRMTNLAIN